MHAIIRDPISSLTHFIGALLSLVALYILTQQALTHGTVWHLVSFVIFGIGMLIMFGSSALYHTVHASDKTIQWLKRIDHMAIFIMIAASYTPFCLVPLHGATGWWLLAAVWGLALFGVILKLVWITAPRWLSTSIYVLMGWLVVFIAPALSVIPTEALHWMVYGGISYTVGALIYATKWPNPWPRWFGFHEIWHLFVMGGAFCHFWAIAYYLADVPVA